MNEIVQPLYGAPIIENEYQVEISAHDFATKAQLAILESKVDAGYGALDEQQKIDHGEIVLLRKEIDSCKEAEQESKKAFDGIRSDLKGQEEFVNRLYDEMYNIQTHNREELSFLYRAAVDEQTERKRFEIKMEFLKKRMTALYIWTAVISILLSISTALLAWR